MARLTDEEFPAWCQRNTIEPQTEAYLQRIRESSPVRKVRSGASNVSGRYPSVKMGCSIQVESQHVELWGIYTMERDDDVLEYYDDSAGLDFSATDPLTISLWFNLSASPSIWHAIGKRAGCGLINYQLAFDSTHGLLFDSGSDIVATGITSVQTGVWTHFAATYSPILHELEVYLNGQSVASQSNYTLAGKTPRRF